MTSILPPSKPCLSRKHLDLHHGHQKCLAEKYFHHYLDFKILLNIMFLSKTEANLLHTVFHFQQNVSSVHVSDDSMFSLVLFETEV